MVSSAVRASTFAICPPVGAASGDGANVVWSINLHPASSSAAAIPHVAFIAATLLQLAGWRARCRRYRRTDLADAGSDQPTYRRQAAVGQPDVDGRDRRDRKGWRPSVDADGG